MSRQPLALGLAVCSRNVISCETHVQYKHTHAECHNIYIRVRIILLNFKYFLYLAL